MKDTVAAAAAAAAGACMAGRPPVQPDCQGKELLEQPSAAWDGKFIDLFSDPKVKNRDAITTNASAFQY